MAAEKEMSPDYSDGEDTAKAETQVCLPEAGMVIARMDDKWKGMMLQVASFWEPQCAEALLEVIDADVAQDILRDAFEVLPDKLPALLGLGGSDPNADHRQALKVVRAACSWKLCSMNMDEFHDEVQAYVGRALDTLIDTELHSKVPDAMVQAFNSQASYREQAALAVTFLSNAVRGAMKLDHLLQKPGAAPLKQLLTQPILEQLEDVKTGQAMLHVLLELQQQADLTSDAEYGSKRQNTSLQSERSSPYFCSTQNSYVHKMS